MFRAFVCSSLSQSLTKWESTVREAVVKMRDDCERRLSPACQRLHLILQDFYGFSKMWVITTAPSLRS
jgi:hypothetical protein